MLDLLQPFISAMGIKAARCACRSRCGSSSGKLTSTMSDDGSMSVKEREESLSRIRSDPQTTVILISYVSRHLPLSSPGQRV